MISLEFVSLYFEIVSKHEHGDLFIFKKNI